MAASFLSCKGSGRLHPYGGGHSFASCVSRSALRHLQFLSITPSPPERHSFANRCLRVLMYPSAERITFMPRMLHRTNPADVK